MREPTPFKKILLRAQDIAWKLRQPYDAKRRMAKYRRGEITFDEALSPDNFLLPSVEYKASHSFLMKQIQEDDMLRSEFRRLDPKERSQVLYLLLFLEGRLIDAIQNKSAKTPPGDTFDLGPRYEGFPPKVVVLCSSAYERGIELHNKGELKLVSTVRKSGRRRD